MDNNDCICGPIKIGHYELCPQRHAPPKKTPCPNGFLAEGGTAWCKGDEGHTGDCDYDIPAHAVEDAHDRLNRTMQDDVSGWTYSGMSAEERWEYQ